MIAGRCAHEGATRRLLLQDAIDQVLSISQKSRVPFMLKGHRTAPETITS